jgi:hypothetical protein
VGVYPDFDLSGEFLVLCAQGVQLLHEAGRKQPDDFRVRYDHVLLTQGLLDRTGKSLGCAGSKSHEACDKALATHSSEGGRCWVSLQQIEDGQMFEVKTQNTFERGMNLREQDTQVIAHLDDLCQEVVVETAQPLQFGKHDVREWQREQRMGHRSACLGADRCIPGIRFGFAGVQVLNAAERQARQMRHCDAFGACNSYGKHPVRRGLIVDEQQRPMGSGLPDQRLELCLTVGQRSVQEPFAPTIECHR